jgi:2,5-dioxopentanoate dehydrogenase
LTGEGPAIVERTNLETGLPVPRIQGELLRTTNQLNLFADVLEEGSWVNARIDEAIQSEIRSVALTFDLCLGH